MTKLERLRAAIDLGGVPQRIVLESALALLDLWEACEAERVAVCETESAETDDWTQAADDECAGDIHADACPVSVARAAVTAVLERGLP